MRKSGLSCKTFEVIEAFHLVNNLFFKSFDLIGFN